MNNNENFFVGPFKDDLFEYYQHKINLGYAFESEKNKLKAFDNYTNFVKCSKLTLELIYDFIDKRKEISSNSKASYICVLRGYVRYLYNSKRCNFLVPERIYKRKREKIPHIFTNEEIKIFFSILNDFYPDDKFKNSLINIYFELLYCTGMRSGECLNIKVNDIDFNNNSITLYNTKNKVDRRIVVSDKLIVKLSNFINEFREIISVGDNGYIFIRHSGKKYKPNDLYSTFRKILYYAGIEHTDNGPRVHDFRHTFCVNSYKKILRDGGNYYNHVMALSAYVGHKNFISTEYYLRLTSELYPEVRKVTENYTEHLIKDMECLDE